MLHARRKIAAGKHSRILRSLHPHILRSLDPHILISSLPVTLIALISIAVLVADPGAQSRSLSPLDYIEIRQLVARYAYAVDTGADNGRVYASLFSSDGAFVGRDGRPVTGRDNLIAIAKRNTRGPQSAFHFIMNHVIEPTAEGATGREYLVQLRIGEADRPNEIFGGGRYDDVYVRTANGWRFKRRQFVPSERPAPAEKAAPAPSPVAAAPNVPAGVVAAAPAKARRGQPARTTLTPLDYLEIQQLVYRYGWALDSGDSNGYAYADLYAPDGTFTGTNQGPSGRSYQGRDALAALARGGRRGPRFVSHYVTNVIVEPAAEGAIGRTYVAIFDIGNGGNGAKSRIDHGGLYNDVYVKTPAGWRFKSRTYFESKSGEPVQPPPATIGIPGALTQAAGGAPKALPTTRAANSAALSAEDYIDLQQLVSRYPYALDIDPDEGASYAALFTPDAVFRQPRTEGRDALARLAVTQPHGPKFVRHFITNHVIDATADGVVGKEYLVVIDIGENGTPSAVFLGGHYEDTYARTADGWRFKTRTFISSATGTPDAAASPPAASQTPPAGR